MKIIGIVVAFLFFFNACNGQVKPQDTATKKAIIKQQAEMMGDFLLKSDFNNFIKYVHPKIIEMMGDKQNAIEMLEKNSKEIILKNIVFLSIKIGEPSTIIMHNNELQCTIPQTLEIKTSKGRFVATSTLIAISMNNGENWYFVDTSTKSIEAIRRIIPSLSKRLIIPKKQQPVFYTD